MLQFSAMALRESVFVLVFVLLLSTSETRCLSV